MVSFRHSERSEESFPEEILRRFAPQNDADRHFATAPLIAASGHRLSWLKLL